MDGLELFDSISDSAILLDRAGKVLNWNAGAALLFGYHKREVLGWSINFIYDQHYPFPRLIQEIHTHQRRWQEETPFIRKNGAKGYCKSHLYPVSCNDQQKVSALLIHHNISLQKKTEEDLIKQLEFTEKRWRESELRFH